MLFKDRQDPPAIEFGLHSFVERALGRRLPQPFGALIAWFVPAALFAFAIACESTPDVKRECLSGNCEAGEGTLVWFVKRYEGEFKEGLMHGQGVMRYSDGRVYTGLWSYGREEGEGEMTWPDGKRYTGQWRGGTPHGRGVLTMPDGYRFDGIFDNGYFVRR